MQGRNCWCTKGARWLPVADEDDKNSQQQKQHGKRDSGSRSQPKLGLISLLGGNLHEFTRSSRKALALSVLNSEHDGYHILIRPSNGSAPCAVDSVEIGTRPFAVLVSEPLQLLLLP